MGWEDALLFAAASACNVAQQLLGTAPGSVLGLLLEAGQQAGLLISLYAGAADDLHEAVQCYVLDRRERDSLLSSGVVQQVRQKEQKVTLEAIGLLRRPSLDLPPLMQQKNPNPTPADGCMLAAIACLSRLWM